jgi:hypothetical protein
LAGKNYVKLLEKSLSNDVIQRTKEENLDGYFRFFGKWVLLDSQTTVAERKEKIITKR